jgi:hypothetical protein
MTFFNPIGESWIYKLYKQKHMKTAMQELLALVEQMFANAKTIEVESAMNDVINIITQESLEKEKEQIIEAFVNGKNKPRHIFQLGEQYYNQTYSQKIPELLYKDGTPMRKVKLGKEAQELLDEVHNEKRGDLVRLLRWVLKHYSTGTDIDGFFMWENPIGEEFDSIQVVDHYLKENK